MKLFRLPVLLLFLGVSTQFAESEEAIRSRIRRQPVVSTNVASIGYSKKLRALEIEFTRGAIYRFLDVPPVIFRGLMSAQSKGHFIAENIRGKFRFVRVRASRNYPKRRLTTNESQPARASPPP